jgi:hypothetical protein
MVAVSLAALTLTLCLALATLFTQPDGFGPPPSQHLALLMQSTGTLALREVRDRSRRAGS